MIIRPFVDEGLEILPDLVAVLQVTGRAVVIDPERV